MVDPVRVPLKNLNGPDGVKTLGRLIRRWERESKTNTYKVLSQRAGLMTNTVSRIAAGETKQPRMTTMVLILVGLGFEAARFE